MKKFTVFLALLAAIVSVGTAQVKKRVSMSTIPSARTGIEASVQSLSTAALSTSLPVVNKLTYGVGVPVMPDYMVAETQYVVFDAPRDTSDSGFALTSRVDPQSRVTTGLYDIPTVVNFSDANNNITPNAIFGYAQFFPPFGTSGSLTIDTVVFQLFQYSRDNQHITPIKRDVLLIPYGIKANLQTRTPGAEFSLDDPGLRQLGDEIEISAATINSALDLTTTPATINNIVLRVPDWKVEAGETFGFVLYSQGPTDTMRLFGTYMWGLKDSTQTLGYVLRRTPAGDEFALKQAGIGFFNPSAEFATAFPSLVNRGLRINYFFVVGGILETTGTGAVETLTNDAKNFSLEQVAPNPVVNATKIQFSLQEPSTVSLRVVNSLGQVVQELASGAMTTGTYAADFDATNLPAGMYYYTLTAGTHSLTRSMVVVK